LSELPLVQYLYLDAVKHVDTLALQALDLVPTKIHERSPIFLGSYDDVEEIKALYAEQAKSSSA
jgi:fructose-1,6-bisphosphatase